MANRPSSTSRAATQSGRKRPTPPVKKSFPWGVVVTSAVLGLLLIGILVYAVTNQGSGFIDPLKAADNKVPGVLKYTESRDHVAGEVKYDHTPPAGGKHNAVAQSCAVYTAPIANEHAVHSLEHGAVWITYRPGLPADQIKALTAKVNANPAYRMMSPFPGLKTPISLQAWNRQIYVKSASDKKVDEFLTAYTQGPQAPENGSCAGTSATGTLAQQAAAGQTGTPMPSAMPSK